MGPGHVLQVTAVVSHALHQAPLKRKLPTGKVMSGQGEESPAPRPPLLHLLLPLHKLLQRWVPIHPTNKTDEREGGGVETHPSPHSRHSSLSIPSVLVPRPVLPLRREAFHHRQEAMIDHDSPLPNSRPSPPGASLLFPPQGQRHASEGRGRLSICLKLQDPSYPSTAMSQRVFGEEGVGEGGRPA